MSQAMLKEIEDIVRDVLGDSSIRLQVETSPMELDDWDSVAHVQIMVALENKYAIKFELRETQQWVDIRSIIGSVNSKLAVA